MMEGYVNVHLLPIFRKKIAYGLKITYLGLLTIDIIAT